MSKRGRKKGERRRAHLDRLVDRARRNDVDELRRLVRLAAGAVGRRAVGLAAGSRRSAPRHGRDEVLVRLEDLEAAARREVPGPDRLVVGRREEELARGVEDERPDPVIVCERRAASAPTRRARE